MATKINEGRSTAHDKAEQALIDLLNELPAEFGSDPEVVVPRYEFKVIKPRNVLTVHKSLWELQKYFGLHP